MKTKLILDTDIGSDVDDALALALCLASPEIELVGVTTVYVDSVSRGKIAAKLLRLAGRDDVPIYTGVDKPIATDKPLFWGGHEGKGLLTEADVQADAASFDIKPGAVKFLREKTCSEDDIYVAAIGPYTNLALAVEGSAANPREILLMGGVYDHHGDKVGVDHNVACDVGAARAVFDSPCAKRVTTIDITLQTRFRKEHVDKVRRCKTPFTDALATLMEIWIDAAGQGYACLHDPLAISPLITPDFVEFKPARISIDERGYTEVLVCPPEDTKTLVSVGVNADAFTEWYFDRVRSFNWPRD